MRSSPSTDGAAAAAIARAGDRADVGPERQAASVRWSCLAPSRRVRLSGRPAATALFVSLWPVLVVSGLPVWGCSGPASPKGEGATCFVVGDCAAGLVCVPTANGARACSKDLTSIVSMEDAAAGDSAPLPMALPQGDDAAPE